MKTNRNTRRTGNAFTLIELLVVTLILAVLMAVALPLYISSVNDSRNKVCRANLQTIANAVQAARTKSGATDYSAFLGAVSTTNEPDLSAVPTCPNAGTYSIAKGKTVGGFLVSCTIDGTFEPGVDSK